MNENQRKNKNNSERAMKEVLFHRLNLDTHHLWTDKFSPRCAFLWSDYQLCGKGQVLTWKCLLPVMCLYFMPFSSNAFANTPSTSCHYKQQRNNCTQKKIKKMKLLVQLEPYRQTSTKINPGFCSTTRLEALLLVPGWGDSLSQGTPQHYWQVAPANKLSIPTTFIHLGGERHCES